MKNTLRALGSIETQMAVMHKRLCGTTQGVVLLPIRGTLDFDASKAASSYIFQKYQSLRCTIQNVDNILHFKESMPANNILYSCDYINRVDDAVTHLINETHNVLDAKKSLWRLKHLSVKNQELSFLILTLHHAIVDNKGCFAIVEDILQVSDDQMNNVEHKLTHVAMPPALDEYLKPMAIAPKGNSTSKFLPHKCQTPVKHRISQYIENITTKDTVKTLKGICKKNGMQIHSLLSVAFTLAAYKSGLSDTPVVLKTAVSLRELANARSGTTTDLGCYISVADTPLNITDDVNLIYLVKKYETDLMQATLSDCTRLQKLSLDDSNTIADNLSGSNSFVHGLGVTNIGCVNIKKEYSNFSLQNFIPMTNRVAGNTSLVMHISQFEGKIFTWFVFTEPLMNRNTVETVRDHFVDILLSFIEQDAQTAEEQGTQQALN